jgi:hypothetical protein
LSGCAVSSGVFETSPGIYRVEGSADVSLGGQAAATGSALKAATEKCQALGKRVDTIDQRSNNQFTGAATTVTFRCI